MTSDLFIFLHRTTATTTVNINREGSININFDIHPTLPNTGTLTGLSVTVKTLSNWADVNGNTLALSAANEIDLENVLLSTTSIRFSLDSQVFNIPILTRARYSNIYGNLNSDFYYFEVVPTNFNITNNIGEPTADIIDITFLPFIQSEKYEYSDNNPLMSNALENRTSTYIQQSDRIASGVKPTNLPEILSGSATLAQTQDSNYSSTGWSNARYVGSKTNAQEYEGIPPAITAKLFTGELNPSSSAENLICSRSLTDRITSELLFTGTQEVPTFEGLVNTRYQTEGSVPISSSIIPYKLNPTPATGSLEIGSIIKVEGNTTELLRVEKIEPDKSRIQVTRNYLGTAGAALADGRKIYVIKPLRIFKLDNTSAKIVNSTNAKIWVKESKEILSTDGYGMVYTSSSLCIT